MSLGPGAGAVQPVFNTTSAVPIVTAGASAAKWVVRHNGVRYAGSSIQPLAFDRFVLVVSANGSEAGASQIRYANAPSDISDAGGRQLAAGAWGF